MTNFNFFILWIIMFSRKNCIYSFFCCSFSESLYTKSHLSGIFLTDILWLFLFFYCKTDTYPQSDWRKHPFWQFAFFLCFWYTFVRKEKEKNLENEMNFLTVISNRSKSRKNLSRSRKKWSNFWKTIFQRSQTLSAAPDR